MGELIFDPIGHKYTLDGRTIPSVTTVISSVIMNPFVGVSRDVLDAAGLRGTYVHDACQMYDEGDLDIGNLDPILQPYVQAWIKFREESGFTPKLIEEKCFDVVRRFAGRLDRAGIMGSTFSKCVCDIKTGEVYADAGIQLAAYQSCMPDEWKTAKRIAVKLCNDGAYRVHSFTDRRDIRIFYSALELWHWRKANGLL